jgi:ferredoxin
LKDCSVLLGEQARAGSTALIPGLWYLMEMNSDVVAPGLEAKAQEGAAICPERAIYVGETQPD